MVYWDNEPGNPWDVVQYESNNISDACEADRVALELRVDGQRYFIETTGHEVERVVEHLESLTVGYARELIEAGEVLDDMEVGLVAQAVEHREWLTQQAHKARLMNA